MFRVGYRCKNVIDFGFKSSRLQRITTWDNEDGSKEIQLKTPWGHIAGKKWGPDGGRKVLAVHGWQDNSGTFDALVPLLNKNLEIYAIDLPGHGISSHYPKGILNNTGEYISVIHRVVKILGLDKFIYLGHSLGAILGYMYTATFPEIVDQYIAIENMKPIAIDPSSLHKINKEAIEGVLKLETKNVNDKNFKGYSKDEAVQRMVKGYFGSVTAESANILLKRGLKPTASGKGYTYSRDLKIKIKGLELGPSNETLLYYGSAIKCDVLHIKARPGIDYEPIEMYKKTVEELRKTAASVTYHEVQGTHHVHLNNPERIAPLINEFIRL